MKIVERVIIRALIQDMKAAGYEVAAVWDGEEYILARGNKTLAVSAAEADSTTPPYWPGHIDRPMTEQEALDAIDAVDDSTLHFAAPNSREWGTHGVLLVLGNGEEVISDYHCSDKKFCAVVDGVFYKIDNEQLG